MHNDGKTTQIDPESTPTLDNGLPPLIPKKILFGNPDKASPRLSPDCKFLAYLAPSPEGVLNVFIRNLSTGEENQLTQDKDSGITVYDWHNNSFDIIFLQDNQGDENWLLYKINIFSSKQICLTPFENVQVQIIGDVKHLPDDMLIGMNKDNPILHDVYHLNLATGALTFRQKNPGNVTDWISDDNLQIRGCLSSRDDGSFDFSLRPNEDSEFELFYSWDYENSSNSGPLLISKDGQSMFLLDSSRSNTTQLLKIDIATKKETLIFQDQKYDISGVILHPDTLDIQAISVTKDRKHLLILDNAIEGDITQLKAKHHEAEFFIGSRSKDDQQWVIGYVQDNGPVMYYIYIRPSKSFKFLFYHHEALSKYTMSKIEPFSFISRDGLSINGYISFPVGKKKRQHPTVLKVHGGPWSRDTWGFDAETQLFTNRGYCCVMVNYRGSSGFGKKFLNAGNKEWGRKMLFDLVDTVTWAIEQGYTDPDKVAIYGGSYGGYAALAAATFTQNIFCCAVDLVGPSNLITFIETIPEYWKPFLAMLQKRVGNIETEQEFLKSRSPLFHVDNITIPLLIAHGANDPRVKQEESEQIVAKLKEKNIPHKYLLFEDEGHGFVKPANRIKFYTALERFFVEYLGGRTEE